MRFLILLVFSTTLAAQQKPAVQPPINPPNAAGGFGDGAISPGKTNAHYVLHLKVPMRGPNTVTVVYDELYPGPRSKRGGCYFMDETKPGSYMPIEEMKSDHVTIQAPRGHVIKADCNWIVDGGK